MIKMDWLYFSLILTFIILSLILFLLIFFGVIKENQVVPDQFANFLEQVSLQGGWDPAKSGIPVAGDRGQCRFYPTFTLQTSVVDQITPGPQVTSLPIELACLDGFSQPLTKYSHTCVQDSCAGYAGGVYKRGEVEYFYESCAKLPNCPNGLSGVIFDPQDQRLCLANRDDQVYVTPCPATVTPQTNTFFAVDYQTRNDLPPGAVAARIRFPGQDLCYLDDLTVGSCTARKDLGYTWAYLPALPIIDERYPNGTVFYPPQLMEYPEGLNLGGDNNDLARQLIKYQTLQTNGTNTYLGPYSLCTTVPGPLPSHCQVTTIPVSAYNWEIV